MLRGPVRAVAFEVIRFQVDAPGRERLHAVVRETDRLTVPEEGEVARLKERLAPLLERLARADAALAPAGLGGHEIDPARFRGFVDGVRAFDFRHLPAQLRGHLGAGLVAEAQKYPGAERLEQRPPTLAAAEHGAQ